MTKAEKSIIEKLEKHKNFLFFLIISLIGLYIRYTGMRFISTDMDAYLMPWYTAIKERGGISALSLRISNYNVLYETLMALMTYIDLKGMYLIKMLSIAFDYVLAICVGLYTCEIKKETIFSLSFNLGYAITLILPTVVYNSAYWGQCDVIYTCFLVLFLLFLYKEKWKSAFIFLGVALAFKFQTIFILPFVIAYYFYKKRFSIFLLLISVSVFWILNSMGMFFGRSPFEPFYIYFGQTNTYPLMYMNMNSFWMIGGSDYEWLKNMAIGITICLCGIGFYLVITGKKRMETHAQYLNTCCWFLYTCLLFLPAMHERYTYPLDILFVLLCFADRRYYKYATISILLSITTYASYLFGNFETTYWHAFLYVVMWIHYTYTIILEDEHTITNVNK